MYFILTSLRRLSGGARQRFQRGQKSRRSLEKELSRSAQATRKDRAKWRRREAGRRVAVSSRARSPSSSSSSSCHRPDVGWRPEDDDTTLAAVLLPDVRRRTLSASAGKMCCKSKTLRLFGTMHRSPSPPHPSRKEPAKNDHVALRMTRSALTPSQYTSEIGSFLVKTLFSQVRRQAIQVLLIVSTYLQ